MILVTGAAGFIGSAFVWELNQRGISDILCVDNYSSDSRWKNLAKRTFTEFIMVEDVFDFLTRSDLAPKIQAIVHLGANSSTTETDVDSLIRNNYYFSQGLFHWSTEHKKTFIYASSAATYGLGELGYDDSTPGQKLQPLNPYGYSKVLFDRWVEKQTHTPPKWIGVKFFNVFGPQEYHKGNMASVAFKAFDQIQTQGSLGLFKSLNPDYQDGKQMRDFVYVKDCTRWLFEMMDKPMANGIYNMGFGKARTWLDLAHAAFSATGKSPQIRWLDVPENVRNQYQYFTEAKLDKLLASGIGEPQWPLEKAVEDYFKNYLLKEDRYL